MTQMLDRLARLIGTGTPVEVFRSKLDVAGTLGFVVGVSPDVLLLHVIEPNSLALNGYVAYRIKDITSYNANDSFIGRAMRLSGQCASIPAGINLSNLPSVMVSAADKYPLITIATERKRPGAIFIGIIAHTSDTEVSIRKVCTKAHWRDPERFKLKRISMVSFGDGYTRSLAALVKAQELQGGNG